MFDKNTITPELKNSYQKYDDLQRQYLEYSIYGKNEEVEKLIPLIKEAEKKYHSEYNKWCDRINAPHMKFKE